MTNNQEQAYLEIENFVNNGIVIPIEGTGKEFLLKIDKSDNLDDLQVISNVIQGARKKGDSIYFRATAICFD